MLSKPPAPIAERIIDYSATPVTDGESGGIVHRLTAADRPTLFLKNGAGRVAADIVDEHRRLRWLAGRWRVPEIVDYAETPAGAWLLTTALPGRSAQQWLNEHPDRQAGAVRAMAKHLAWMHQLPIESCPFDAGLPRRIEAARSNAATGQVDLDDLDPEREGWSVAQLLARLDSLLPSVIDPVVTHGDFSLDNIFLDEDGAVTGCLDVGRAGVADRWQDLSILWNCLRDIDPALTDTLFDAYGVRIDPAKIELYLLLDEFF